MRKTILFLAFFGLTFAQVTGSVTDSNGNPIAAANIILDNGMGAATGEDGSFSFSTGLPVMMTVSAVGFEDLTLSAKESNVTIILNSEPIALDPIDVLASASSITAGMYLRSVHPSAVATELELKQFDDTDVMRVLGRIPGVYVQEEDGYGLRPNIGIRGTGLSRMEKLNVMEDGILIAPAPYASPAAYYSPTMGRMERLEVRKGSAQIKYGPFTTGGSLNYVSTSIPENKLTHVDLTLGSFGRNTLHIKHGDNEGKMAYLVQLFNDKTDGFKELDGGGDTGYSKLDLLTKFRYMINDNHAIEMKWSMTDEISDETYLGLTDDDFTSNPLRRYRATQLDEMDADHSQFVLSYATKLSDNISLSASWYRNDFARNWFKLNKVNDAKLSTITEDPSTDGWADFYALMDATDSVNDAYRVKANNREYYSQGLQAVINATFGNHDLQSGVRVHYDEMDRFQWEHRYKMSGGNLVMTTEAVKGSDSNRIDSADATALFIEDRITSGDWTVTGGFRYEEITVNRDDWGKTDPNRSESPTTKKQTFDVVVPGVSVEYAFSPSQTISYGIHKGFAPHGPGGVKVVDGVTQEIEPETSINHEIGFRSYKGLQGVEFTYFINNYDNLLGADTQAAGSGTDELYNGGAVDISGFELYLRYMLAVLHLELAYTHTNTEFKESFDGDFWGNVSSGDELPYVPSDVLYLNVGMNMGIMSSNVSLKHTSEMR
ncbi:MAG: TonB-dependent receptor, partial [Candidatus Neomarinimicrobiota bacterium]|nr:TonB-dependent receptor [Candidatus Neomarinimicrobiota bacterium]